MPPALGYGRNNQKKLLYMFFARHSFSLSSDARQTPWRTISSLLIHARPHGKPSRKNSVDGEKAPTRLHTAIRNDSEGAHALANKLEQH